MLRRIRESGEQVGVVFLVLGLIFIVVIFLLNVISEPPAIDFLGIALGLVSVGLGGIAIGISEHSDARMEAMANLKFDEKLAVMLDYSEPASKWENVYYETRAALRLQRWVSEATKSEFKRALEMVIKQAKVDKDEDLVSKLKGLWQEYNIDKW